MNLQEQRLRRMLTSPNVEGSAKRDALGLLVERVAPLRKGAKTGAQVDFRQGVLGEGDTLGEDGAGNYEVGGAPEAGPEIWVYIR